MSSFLRDVLATASTVEKIDLKEKVAELKKEITKLKYDVKEFMDDNFITFVPKLKKDQALASKAAKFVEEMNTLQTRVENQIKIELSGSTRELKSLSNDLKESNISLKLSSQLLELHECLESVETFGQNKRYIDAAKSLNRIEALLNDRDSDLPLLDIYQPLKNEYRRSYATFLRDVSSLWQQYVSWKESTDANEQSCAQLTIECDFEEVQDLIKVLDYVNYLPDCLNGLSANLMKLLITPIIRYECSVYVVGEKIFTVKTLNKKSKPTYESVLYNLKLLFKFLNQHLNVTLENGQTFMNKIRPCLLAEFSGILIKHCIVDTIPSSNAELQNFGPIVENIKQFQDYLVELGFVPKDELFLSEYTKNVDSLYMNKICQNLLAKARLIMKKDLHDSMKYEPQEPLGFPEQSSEDSNVKIDRKLSSVTFQLPPCQISKSVKEILDLARDILNEACNSSDLCAVRLYYTSRNVFEMYAGLVPEHHKKLLETIPQQVALFHNNCMYLAHHLLTLAHEFKDKLPDVLRNHNLTYVDQTLELRKAGSVCFLEHMKYQRNIIIDIIRESGLSTLGQTTELPASTERAIRQCIRQLELLKTVWLNVLPTNVYCKAVGCLMNSMIEDVVAKVISVEDIPEKVATELVALFDMIIKRAPSVFPDPDVIQRYVRTWGKLTELVKVLGATLREMDERWADGKGPLAHEFTAPQVKQLIRALFQNTERRSALLATIK